MHRHNKETGFSLLEVLITILVLSIGLLGFAGLQAQSLRTNNSASQGSAATALANEIINRMRANRASAATPAGAYSETSAGQLGVLNPACDTPAPQKNKTCPKSLATKRSSGIDGPFSMKRIPHRNFSLLFVY